MVEGVCQPLGDSLGNAVRIAKHIDCSDPQHFKPFLDHEFVASGISSLPLLDPMNFAIDFDNQSRFKAAEVRHIGPKRMLTSELHTDSTAPWPLPQHCLRKTHFLSQLARLIDLRPLLG
jgi:hypothetical protein